MTIQQIGDVVAQARRDQSLSQTTLAELLGIRRQSLIEIENCQCNYRVDRLIEVLEGLGLEITIAPKPRNGFNFKGVKSARLVDLPSKEKVGKVKN